MSRYVAIKASDVDTCCAVNWAETSIASMIEHEADDVLQAWTQAPTGESQRLAVYDRQTGRVYQEADLREML